MPTVMDEVTHEGAAELLPAGGARRRAAKEGLPQDFSHDIGKDCSLSGDAAVAVEGLAEELLT